jgi:predicted nuclease with TOPRIM domain
MDDNYTKSAEVVVSLTEMINTSLGAIEKVKEDRAKISEMLQSMLDNDPNYAEVSLKAKEAGKVKSQAKKQVMRTPQAADLERKLSELRDRLKELNMSLSDYLNEYIRQTGNMQFEDSSGKVRDIKMKYGF